MSKKRAHFPEEQALIDSDARPNRELTHDPLEVGPAPEGATREERELWNEFVNSLPWLASSDRPLLIRAVKLGTRIDRYEALLDSELDGEVSTPRLNALRQLRDNTDKAYQGLVADMGGLPRTRPQVPISYADEDAEALSQLADGNEEIVSFDD